MLAWIKSLFGAAKSTGEAVVTPDTAKQALAPEPKPQAKKKAAARARKPRSKV
jgi:hypothetical protein